MEGDLRQLAPTDRTKPLLAELQHALARYDFADVKVDYQTLYGSAIVTAIKR